MVKRSKKLAKTGGKSTKRRTKGGAPRAASTRRRADSASASPGLDPEVQTLRERLGDLKEHAKELRAAKAELSEQRAELRDRAGVIEQRYAELLERITAASATAAPEAAELQSLRDALDEVRRQRDAAARTKSFWMVCPKCGGTLEEIDHRGVKIDRCQGCAGVYLDRGELELLTSTGEAAGFFVSIRSLFT